MGTFSFLDNYCLDHLWKRFGNDNVVGVGVGIAQKDGEDDPDRPYSAQIIVKEKRKSVRSNERVPKKVSIPLGISSGSGIPPSINLPTDILVDRKVVQCGGEVRKNRLDGSFAQVTTGCVVRWVEQSSTGNQTQFGVLTVAHDFLRDHKK